MVRVVESFLQGLDKPIILWLLSRSPRYGYELIKELKRITGHKLKPSRVYPFLHWLEEEGFAVSKWVENGRRRIRYYSLTNKGKKLLRRVRDLFNEPIKEAIKDLIG